MSATARASLACRISATTRTPSAGKCPAELPVAADGGRQRVRPEPFAAPEHHELKGGVDGQRVGQPGAPQRPLDPLRTAPATVDDPARDRPLAQPSTRSIPCIAGPWNRTV